MPEIYQYEPASFRVGDTVKWILDVSSDFSTSEYTLTYTFFNSSSSFTAQGEAYTEYSYLITISASDSSKLTAGEYSYVAQLSNDEDVYTVSTGTVTVLPAPASGPASFRVGDTVKWILDVSSDFSTSEYTLTYTFFNSSSSFTAQGEAYTEYSYLITISASDSSKLTAGEYSYVAQLSNDEDVYTVSTGTVTVLPAPASGVDGRSHVKKVLDALEAAIEGRATRTDLEYQIGDKRIRHMSAGELYQAWRKYKSLYEQELSAERVAKGLKPLNKIYTRFSR